MRLQGFLVSLRLVGLQASGLLLLGDLLLMPACRTNGRTGFLLAVCAYFFCILLCFEHVGLAVYLALLTRLRLVLARRLRALLSVLVGYSSCRANPCAYVCYVYVNAYTM